MPGVGLCQEAMAEINRRLGNPERAAEIYQSCIELQRAIGHPQALSQLNLAIIRVLHGDVENAERLFVEAADFFDASGRRMLAMVATAGLLACAAAREWWGNIRDPLESLEAELDDISQGERDLAELLEFAGDRLCEADRFPLARRVYELARRQWRWLEADDRLESLEDKLADCD